MDLGRESRRGGRPAYTLMEMLLVLAILVVLAAVSVPAMRGALRDQALTSAADAVRTEWTRCHVRAMKTGQIQVFRFELDGRKYMVQPYSAGDEAIEGAAEDLSLAAPSEAELGFERQLPDETYFVTGDTGMDLRSLAVEEQVQSMTPFQAEWSRPILFYPDGSSSDAYVVVGNERQVGIRIELRGMTGGAKLGEIRSLEELLSE